MTHGNTRYPELHDKAALEDLVSRYKTPTAIAKAIGCKRQNVCAALKTHGIRAKCDGRKVRVWRR